MIKNVDKIQPYQTGLLPPSLIEGIKTMLTDAIKNAIEGDMNAVNLRFMAAFWREYTDGYTDKYRDEWQGIPNLARKVVLLRNTIYSGYRLFKAGLRDDDSYKGLSNSFNNMLHDDAALQIVMSAYMAKPNGLVPNELGEV